LSVGILFAFACVFVYSGFALITRHIGSSDTTDVTLFYSLLVGTVVVAPFAISVWVWPTDKFVMLLMISLGVWGALGHYLFIIAYRLAPASSVAPFIYLQLISTTALGFLLFGDLPDLWTLAGAAVVIASGVYLVHRENVTRAQAKSAAKSAAGT
jgi:drug/metabolite transporter (DMT)-like permease